MEKFTHIDSVQIFAPKEVTISDWAREIELLYWRARMTAKQIAEALGIAESTVRYHIKKIRESDYIVLALGQDA